MRTFLKKVKFDAFYQIFGLNVSVSFHVKLKIRIQIIRFDVLIQKWNQEILSALFRNLRVRNSEFFHAPPRLNVIAAVKVGECQGY